MDKHLVLEDHLLKEYMKFKYDKNPKIDKITKLFDYYKPHITTVKQLGGVYENLNLPINKMILQQLANKRLISNSLIDLAKKTKLKIILSEDKSFYPYVNINGDEFESNFTATYQKNNNKIKVLKHIKELVSSGDEVEIYDKYLFHDNKRGNLEIDSHFSVKAIKKMVEENLSRKFKLLFSSNGQNVGEPLRIDGRKLVITNLTSNVSVQNCGLCEHDRYIKIYKDNKQLYEIILSSGVYNILSLEKDFTYIVRAF